jgi:hypothetical protein
VTAEDALRPSIVLTLLKSAKRNSLNPFDHLAGVPSSITRNRESATSSPTAGKPPPAAAKIVATA